MRFLTHAVGPRFTRRTVGMGYLYLFIYTGRLFLIVLKYQNNPSLTVGKVSHRKVRTELCDFLCRFFLVTLSVIKKFLKNFLLTIDFGCQRLQLDLYEFENYA